MERRSIRVRTAPKGIEPGSQQAQRRLSRLVRELLACDRCPNMLKPVVSGGPVLSKVMLVGQAPGDKEPILGRPFAWTAGKTLFKWFEAGVGISEVEFRSRIYMAAACRCFPGKRPEGGDRVPDRVEVKNCSYWRDREIETLQPSLVIPVGKLGISQFLANPRLDEVVGKQFSMRVGSNTFDLIPLPHPSGASPWHRMEPGLSLLRKAMDLAARHPAMRDLVRAVEAERRAKKL